ncbi:MAG: porin family protein [Bacteroidaceae bacterium]|nr:porin family protein [Bacteroidaceae bacterium]
MNKKDYLIALGVVVAVSSCTTTTYTSNVTDVSTDIRSATVADLQAGERITHTIAPSKSVRRGGMANIRHAVEAEALEKKGGNADVLLDPEYSVTKQRTLLGTKVTSITVSGRPATYTNFRTLNDSVWTNPTFCGLRTTSGHHLLNGRGILTTPQKAVRKGIGAYLNVNPAVGFSDEASFIAPTFTLGYNITPQWFVGLGVGHWWTNHSPSHFITVFGNARYYFSPALKTVFVDAKAGILNEYEDTTLLQLGIGYNWKHFEVAAQYTRTEYEQENRNFIGFSLGWRF